jgi:hypothetical protein
LVSAELREHRQRDRDADGGAEPHHHLPIRLIGGRGAWQTSAA